MDLAKYRTLFIDEGREHLAEVSKELLAFEHVSDHQQLLSEVIRHLHSIKGMAASMGHENIVGSVHRFEDLITQTPIINVDLLLQHVDTLAKQFDAVAKERKIATVRISTGALDDVLESLDNLTLTREKLRTLLEHRPDALNVLETLDLQAKTLREKIISMRMISIHMITERYPGMIRELAHRLGKEVEFEMVGGDIEIDRHVLDDLDAPLVHALRNAVDHGIEPIATRVAIGKPAAGRIVLAARRHRHFVTITLEDDGHGLDTALLKKRVVERGLLSAREAAALSDHDACMLICLPGFSTRREVTDISGRGFGMDIVRARIEKLGGTLSIESTLGAGTRFIFRVPLALPPR